MLDLTTLVRERIAEIGVIEASRLFGVSSGTISNWSNGKTLPSITAAQLMLSECEIDRPATPAAVTPYKLAVWEGKKVMVLLPVYRTLNPNTHFTLFANYAKYGPDKIGMVMKDRTVIHENRNELIQIAMSFPEVETFIMIDDDMVPPCGSVDIFNGYYRAGVRHESAAMNAISRLMSHGRDKQIVGALYYGRHEYGMPQCDWGFNTGSAQKADAFRNERYQGLLPQNWVGTGMIKIERTAIEIFKSAIDAGKYPGLEPLPGRWYGYFTPLKAGVGEDVSFCHRMHELGVQSYVDASLVCLHADGGSYWGPKNTKNKPN